jgi:hypothetical protein
VPSSHRDDTDDSHEEQCGRQLEGHHRIGEENAAEAVDPSKAGLGNWTRQGAMSLRQDANGHRQRRNSADDEECSADGANDETSTIGGRDRIGSEHHDDEQKKYDDGARVHDELNRREKLSVKRQEKPGDADHEKQQPHGGARWIS